MRSRLPSGDPGLSVLGLFALSLLFATETAGASELDPEALLKRRGVRLVAIEFSASWCSACVATAPRWAELRRRHARAGLQSVVVLSRDPEGCARAPKSASESIICDEDGAIADDFGVEQIPAAFLWSWDRGELVRRGSVEDVERELDAWAANAPRVAVSAPAGIAELVRAELLRQGKLEVVATEAERKRLRALAVRSFGASYDEAKRCDLGSEVPANGLLEAHVAAGELRMKLLSAERGCLVRAAVVGFDPYAKADSVAEAVAALLGVEAPPRRAKADRARAGMQRLERLENRVESYRRIPVSFNGKALAEKAREADALRAEYLQVIERGDAKTSVAAWARMAEIYLHFAEEIRRAASGVAELEAMAVGPEERAREAMRNGRALAERAGVPWPRQ